MKSLILVIPIFALFILTCCTKKSDNNVVPTVTENQLQFIVEYDKSWSGILETDDKSISISGTGNKTYSYYWPNFGGFCYISAQKQDGGSTSLTVKIRHIIKYTNSSENTDKIDEQASTSAGFGIASVNTSYASN